MSVDLRREKKGIEMAEVYQIKNPASQTSWL